MKTKTARYGPERRAEFYFDSLSFAQGYWMEGKPAQSILQLNKAFSAEISEDEHVFE